MTPAERARQIDRDEFAAECAAIRQRAYERFAVSAPAKPEPRVHVWVRREEPKIVYKPFVVRKPRTDCGGTRRHTVGEQSLTLKQWADRLGITPNAMHQRVYRHGTVVAAILKHIEHSGPDVLSPQEKEATE